jgi:aminoglycoside phosphotransferase
MQSMVPRKGSGDIDLPDELAVKLIGRVFEPISLGESGASVWRCTMERSTPLYLKVASIAADLRLDGEADRLRWMKGHGLPVPAVTEYGSLVDTEYLILEEAAGLAASDPAWATFLPEVVHAIGAGLSVLHGTSVVACPFDHRIARQIEEARLRMAAGRVREDDFDEIRAGRRATDLFAELLSSIPSNEDLVFTHGDFCLPNIILRRSPGGVVEIAGLIDCGRSGIADRHQDLALAVRSITYNFGGNWVEPFLEAYGLPHPHSEKLRFFTLLDEFF